MLYIERERVASILGLLELLKPFRSSFVKSRLSGQRFYETRMAEIISLIASAVGVAGVLPAKHSSNKFDEIRNAFGEIEAISKDTHAFHAVVSSMLLVVRNSTVVTGLQQDQELCRAVIDLKDFLQICPVVLQQIQSLVRSHLKPADGRHRIS